MLQCGRYRFDLERPLVMGIVNVTPDSFSDGGRYADAGRAGAPSGDHQGAGQQARTAGCACLAAHQDQAAPHAVAEAIAGIARHRDDAAAHAGTVADQRGAEPVAGIAGDAQQAALHAVGGAIAGVAFDEQFAAAQTLAGIVPGRALDAQRAGRHALAEAIETAAAGTNQQRGAGLARRHREQIAQRHGITVQPHGLRGDVAGGAAAQGFGQHAAHVDAAGRGGTQSQCHGAHARISRRR